ncbi:1-(5-phosphoribosyl)-5-[(5-phosphoribosylamino)methylideneamino]imidazole-4-carboxamide isomerase [Lysobacter brunescens]|uniref:1-(5-phosphoribosyl)-5-[(5-phosphoribosylamino)methylideneamino] imidazole-4-carboxamide isomerase n=1 Tax=Lysobacter brunescens TaxID=262323 RepID=A0ABW2YGF7_9GAMM
MSSAVSTSPTSTVSVPADDAFVSYPAIDVRGGRVVRLRQGDYAQETTYADDPFAVAMRYADAGARWLHLVDLDAARDGGYTLAPLLRRIAADGRLRVQTGGGVRNEAAVEAMLSQGAARVVVGSLAVREPALVAGWLQRYGVERITIALDTRQDADGVWQLPVHGWTENAGLDLGACLDLYRDAGARHLLCTDIARDGMLQGPNLDLYRLLVARNDGFLVQASGGVRDIADIVASREAGCAGAVLGRALLEGRFDLAEALAC